MGGYFTIGINGFFNNDYPISGDRLNPTAPGADKSAFFDNMALTARFLHKGFVPSGTFKYRRQGQLIQCNFFQGSLWITLDWLR